MFDEIYNGLTAGTKTEAQKVKDANAVAAASTSDSPWSTLWANTFGQAQDVAKTTPQKATSYYYDLLKKAGLSSSKPSQATLQKVQAVLVKVVSPADACLLLAWLGGAHDAADPQFASTSSALSAQAACGQEPTGVDAAKKAAAGVGAAQGSVFGPAGALVGAAAGWLGATFAGKATYRSVGSVLADMATRNSDLQKCAELIKAAGTATAKESAKKANKEANADALKLAKDSLAAVTPEGLGSGVKVGVAVAAGVAVLVIAYKVLK